MRRPYKIAAIVIALATAAGFYRYRWGVLGVVGIGPRKLACGDVAALQAYLDTGGDPSAYLWRTPLIMCAAEVGSEEVVTELIEAGTDVNAQKNGPWLPVMSPGLDDTALHAAVRKNNAEISRILIKNGADVNLQNSFEQSPLDIAIGTGQNLVLGVFLAQETLTYEIHDGAITAAVENRHLETMALLGFV